MARLMNDATAAIVRAHPDRFAGVGSLPLADVAASLDELDRIVGELGLHGVMIGSNIAGVQVNDRRFEPVWARMDELRLPVFEHPMFPPNIKKEEFELPLRLGFIFDTTTAAARLIYSGVFERYPNFPYIMAHTGGALLMLLERLDNGYRLFPGLPQAHQEAAERVREAAVLRHGVLLRAGADDGAQHRRRPSTFCSARTSR